MSKSVCFDVLGTCFGFEVAIKAIEERLGPRLKAIGVDPKTLFFSWYRAQMDYHALTDEMAGSTQHNEISLTPQS